ncbi:MAG: insulinase family protein [Acidobacteria bacterium]|nr:MAG: insulinase family protein [Acidobacteriota bacterium]
MGGGVGERVRARPANGQDAGLRQRDEPRHHRSVPEDSVGAGRRQGGRDPGGGRPPRDGGDRSGRAGDEDRHGRVAARCRRRSGAARHQGRARQVRRAQRSHRRVHDRPSPRAARRRPGGDLPDGQQALASGRVDARQSVLRQGDADLRQLPVNISFTKHTLANGLDVLVHEDHACPIVAVNLWYHVGSKNERPGHTGFAHLFEHLMFEGSQHHDRGYFQPLQGAGATLNGSTNADRTNYWEVVPSGALDLALWMESDRMGYLLPAVTEAKFANQRDVVMNERRQNYENRPYGLAPMALLAALFPPDHPYHWTTIGEIADLKAVQLDEVHAFFRRYYHPANASIALAGDIDREQALALVERYFGEIDAGDRVEPVGASASLTHDVRLRFEDRVELPRLYLAWLSPAMFAEGDAELDLATDLLANGKTSRLYRRLVFDERLATDVSASQNSREITGYVQITATAAPGHALAELERAIFEEIARLTADGPTDEEIDRGRIQTETQFMFRLQTVGGFGGKSDQLNAYNVFLKDPAYFGRDLARYQVVTKSSLQEVAGRYLDPARRVTLSIVPHDRTALAAPDSDPAVVS